MPLVVDELNAIPSMSCGVPAGAFYAFPDVRGVPLASDDLASRLLEQAGVATLSGTAFGASGQGYLRFSYANSVDAIRAALDAIEATLPGFKG